MREITLGKTGIKSITNAFGALPIQRISDQDAVYLLKKAYAGGIRFFDTARYYSDSEHKLGLAFKDIIENLYIATKTGASCGEELEKDLAISLENLKTDYIDIYQFHNPAFCPRPGDDSGLYDAALAAKKARCCCY